MGKSGREWCYRQVVASIRDADRSRLGLPVSFYRWMHPYMEVSLLTYTLPPSSNFYHSVHTNLLAELVLGNMAAVLLIRAIIHPHL